ncbi:MAG TPA: IS21 family transposase, partial [Polyangiaceae bacterium]|nr:IS21 family transposase [Polyangiaceae bacterium]
MEKAPKLRVTTLLRELRRRGYAGGYTILRGYVNQVRPKPVSRPAVRVEHLPGRQAQADWSPYRTALAGDDKPSEWGCVLSYSKFSYRHFRLDERQPTVFREIARSLESFQGVPDEIVFDSMSGIVDRWEINEPVLNIRAIDFAAYYGFTLHIAPRGQGQYKGIVEHIFLDTENQLLDGAPTFGSLEELNAACARWTHEQNRRIHATTKRRPIDLLALERPLLEPLPAKPYDTRDLAYRIPDGYGRVHFDGNRYTVPPSYVGRMVYVRADDERVEVFDGQATRIAEHERQPRGADVDVTAVAHRVVRKRVSYDILLGRFAEWGDEAHAYAQELKRRKRYGRAQLVAILELQRTYRADDILAAICHAKTFGAYDAQQLMRILELRATPRTLEDQLA